MGGLTTGIFWGALVSAVGLAALSLSSPLPPRDGGAGAGAVALEPPGAGAAEAVAEARAEEIREEVSGLLPAGASGEAPAEDPSRAATGAAGVGAETFAAGGAAETAAPATEIPLPSGSEFNRPPPEPEPALPAPDAAPRATAPQGPSLVGGVSTPSLDTAPAALPRVAAVGPAQIATEAGEVTAPASPAASPAPEIAGGPSALTQPEASALPQVSTAPVPRATEEPETGAPEAAAAPVDVAAADDPEVVPLQTPEFPAIGGGAASAEATPDVPADAAAGGAADVPVADVTAPALPQISGLPQVAPAVGEAVVLPTQEAAPAPTDDLPAIRAHAAPFDGAEARPLMAVVLIDEPDNRIDLSTLTRFTFPVAFAVDPLHPEAAERARAYRAAGFEVVILGAMFPEGATAADAEMAWAAAARTLPEAVAVIDTPDGRIQGDRPVLDVMVAALSESGHGLLAFPSGLNAAEQSATRAGVPAATIFRFLDDEDERATVITRFLSRAAFAAAQEGSVIVVGRTRPDTVTALFSWALGGRSEAVALAPVSATLLRGVAN